MISETPQAVIDAVAKVIYNDKFTARRIIEELFDAGYTIQPISGKLITDAGIRQRNPYPSTYDVRATIAVEPGTFGVHVPHVDYRSLFKSAYLEAVSKETASKFAYSLVDRVFPDIHAALKLRVAELPSEEQP
jgi:hypothetical protein